MHFASVRALRSARHSRVLLSVAVLLVACSRQVPSQPDAGGDVTVRTELLEAFGTCALTTVRDFHARATALETATQALMAQPDPDTLASAREAFRQALDAWQVAEPMRFGPAAPMSVHGGADMRDHIYSWPLVSRCAVEEQLVSRGYESATFSSSLVNRRGLGALEYLLFYEGEDTACPPSSTIVSGGEWAALTPEERAARKRAYAAVVAADVRSRAATLVSAWEPASGNFVQTLATAGQGSAVYPSTQAALNAVSDSLFYIELGVKDMKLAPALGLRPEECASATCPELLESRFAGMSKTNMRANLEGARRLLQGCGESHAGMGFDDLLEAVNAGAAATTLRERMDAVESALAAIEEPDLREALEQDPASVRAVYDSLKAVTDVMKTDFVTVLDLELPQSIEGDND
ncbi:MAG: imelysin family protein [Myxococcaceae bacterium]|nr:imelysin family protein [Myxococcaceae bacterium]MCI0670966.1 imelysin family protein [Myxococcaceae bacterium]